MNQNAKKWVEALRSGKYNQGKHFLASSVISDELNASAKTNYCCLGVACELAVEAGVISPPKHVPDGSRRIHYYEQAYHASLPLLVRDWLGLASMDGAYDKGYRSLSSHNDNGLSFNQIADIIESVPHGLFKPEAPPFHKV